MAILPSLRRFLLGLFAAFGFGLFVAWLGVGVGVVLGVCALLGLGRIEPNPVSTSHKSHRYARYHDSMYGSFPFVHS